LLGFTDLLMDIILKSALISVYNKEGLEPLVRRLHELDVKLFSTGGTQLFIEQLGIPCTSVEKVTGHPSILGGRVKTLHPKIFGGILARRNFESDHKHVIAYDIPLFDLVLVDLYPFEQAVATTEDEAEIIEKIDIGGVSLIRAAAKNFSDVCVIASRNQYADFLFLLEQKNGETSETDRKKMAGQAFTSCAHYDVAIANYFNQETDADYFQISKGNKQILRYGENPHQHGSFFGDFKPVFEKLNGKELSYNNLVDIDAACKVAAAFKNTMFAIVKHTNVCGIAERENVADAWAAALACDPESAFGGILVTNSTVNLETAKSVTELFFEVLIAPAYTVDALEVLKTKKNRIILQQKQVFDVGTEYKQILNGVLVQDCDKAGHKNWLEAGARTSTDAEKEDLIFANKVCKFLKSNAITIVKNKQLIGKGCGQTSRIDALKQAIGKAKQFGFETEGAVLASDAFFPFSDCVELAHAAGIYAVIQPGGSIRDEDSINYCQQHNMVMVLTETRHFKH
jgi:phosphoribosylaminoimidazolecarboxamide formyltransferase / IMP cyclohydrolase